MQHALDGSLAGAEYPSPPNAMRFSREGAAPSYFLLRRLFRERRVFVGCKRLILIEAPVFGGAW
jgi:hypothetical protein